MKILKHDISAFKKLEEIPEGIDAYLINDPEENLPLASVYAKMKTGAEITCSLTSSFEVVVIKSGKVEVTSPTGTKVLEKGDIAYFPATGKAEDKVSYKALVDSEAVSFEAEI